MVTFIIIWLACGVIGTILVIHNELKHDDITITKLCGFIFIPFVGLMALVVVLSCLFGDKVVFKRR